MQLIKLKSHFFWDCFLIWIPVARNHPAAGFPGQLEYHLPAFAADKSEYLRISGLSAAGLKCPGMSSVRHVGLLLRKNILWFSTCLCSRSTVRKSSLCCRYMCRPLRHPLNLQNCRLRHPHHLSWCFLMSCLRMTEGIAHNHLNK